MDKKCKNCIKDDIGCNIIKQLRKDVLKIKVNRSCLHIIALLVCILGFIVAGLFAFRTFCPVPSAKNMVFDVKISGEKNIAGDAKAEIKKELAEALIEVENRAVAAYNEKFTILLTVLTIFGIAWPLVVAILQLRFNEGELKKIKEAEEKATTANELAKNMKEQMEDVTKKTNGMLASCIEMQLFKDEFNSLKHNFYSEMSDIFSALSLLFPSMSGTKILTPLDSVKVSALFYCNKLYYFCINDTVDEKDIKTCCDNLVLILQMMEAKAQEEKSNLNFKGEIFANNFWNVIKKRMSTEDYNKIRELFDKTF